MAVAHDAAFIARLLEAIETDVVPKTQAGVLEGNKVFGACILRKGSLETVVADTNRETEWPLLHGEVSTLRSYEALCCSKKPATTKQCVFISTHEPCSLCLSAITWSGFDNFYYLFSYFDTKDAFNIPHDLKMLDEVFKCPDGAYRRHNSYWRCHSITALIAALDDGEAKKALEARVTALRTAYDAMSTTYQDSKAKGNAIPLS